MDIIEKLIEEANEEVIYDLWLKRGYGVSFEEFKNGVEYGMNKKEEKQEDVITYSLSVLESFKP